MAIDLVSQKMWSNKSAEVKNIKPKECNSIIEEYLLNSNLDLYDIVGMASDLILAGIDTVRKKIYTAA